MTVYEAYVKALGLLATSPQEDNSLEEYATGWVNLALSEMLPAENALRSAAGQPTLPAAPVLAGAQDTLPYNERLTGNALIYFLASLIARDDDDDYWAQDFRSRYLIALNEATPASLENIADVYWGAGE